MVCNIMDLCTYAHLESKSVAGTHMGLEPHHPKIEKGTHILEIKI